MDEEDSPYAGLAQENSFGSAQLRGLSWLKECNKYDLTVAQCLLLARDNDWSPPQPICCPRFSFMGGVAKEHIKNLDVKNIFAELGQQFCCGGGISKFPASSTAR